MWRTSLEQTVRAALYFGLVLSLLAREGGAVKVACQPGQTITLPCSYHYEDQTHIPELSVQWRGPNNELLCHYIKHKAFRNCTAGYAIAYRPGSIALTIQSVKTDDFGAHVCSVSKRHEFSDYRIELDGRMEETVTSAPNTGRKLSVPPWTLTVLKTLALLVCM